MAKVALVQREKMLLEVGPADRSHNALWYVIGTQNCERFLFGGREVFAGTECGNMYKGFLEIQSTKS